ncbi:MAG: hypothetical protein KDA96_21355, partial [Planctomycetaceae bacterium]|nr:hypothetical protein [Planctomycetaceae bacterium]
GEPIWFVDGWPVAVRVPYGNGLVLVTTISPEVFAVSRATKNELEPSHETIASMRRFQDTFFNPRSSSLIREEPVTAQAAAQIGYQIPSRSFAVALSLSFPLLLLVGGTALLKRHAGEKLIWLLPATAVLVSVPAIGRAWIARGVAPQTVIQTQLIQTLPGQSTLISDGYVTTYNPDPVTLSVKADDSAVLELRQDSTNLDYRRLVWTGRDQNEWVNLKQPAGIETFRVRNTRHFSAPIDALGTFDKDGLTGQLSAGDLQNFRNAVLAGPIPERSSVQLDGEGRFRSASTDVLAAGQFFRTSMINDEQRQHSGILESVFTQGQRLEAFPEQPSLLCWADASPSAIDVGGEQARRHNSLLLVIPVRLEAPAEGSSITIPPTFMPFRVMADESGSFSTLFNNNKRLWDQNGRESAGTIRLQFDLPRVCLPFEADLAEVHLKIRAGSRNVRIFGGPLNRLEMVHELNSPVGAFDFTIPAESLRETARAGNVYLELKVSDLPGSPQTISDSGEQDDSWLVESLHMTLRGRRVSIDID